MADSILKLRVEDQEYNAKLRNATAGLDHYISNCRKVGGTLEVVEKDTLDFVQALGKMPTVAQGSTQSLREMTRTVGDLTIMYRGLTDEEKNSPFGQALAQGIQELTSRAGQARDAIDDVQSSIKYAASDTQTFDTLTSSARLMAAGFQVVSGAAKLMGVDMSDNIELQTKLQSAMSISMGLLQAQNLLQKESAVLQGVDAIQTRANAIAKALLAKNTAAATAAGEAFNVVANANPYVLIASAVIAAGGAMITFARHSAEASEEMKRNEEVTKRAKDTADAFKKTMASSYADLMSKYDQLRREWQQLSDKQSKNQWIEDNKKAFDELGIAVNNVATADQVFLQSNSQIIDGFKKRAEAAALAAQMTDLYRQQLELQQRMTERYNAKRYRAYGTILSRQQLKDIRTNEGWTRDANPNQWGEITYNNGRYIQSGNNPSNITISAQVAEEWNKNLLQTDDELKTIRTEGQAINRQIEQANDRLTKLASNMPVVGSGTKMTFPVGSLPQLNQQLKEYQEAQSKSLDPQQWQEYQQKIEKTQFMIDAFQGKWKDGLTATFTIDVDDEQVLSQLSKIEGATIEDKTITVDTVEAYQKVNELVTNIQDKDVTFAVTPEIDRAIGKSITTSSGLNDYISGLKKQLQDADFGSDLYQSLTEKLADATLLQNLVKEALSVGLGTALFDIADETGQDFWDRVISPEGVADADWEAIAAAINAKLEELGLDPITIDVNTGNVTSGKGTEGNEVWEHTQEIVSGMSQVSSGLDRMGIELPQAVQDGVNTMQGMIQTINGIQTIAHGLGTTAPALIQAAATGVQSSIALLIQALNLNTASNSASATSDIAETAIAVMLAHGGMVPHAALGYAVPGTHYSGDKTPILANAGELVLNRAQQGNLASQLQSGESLQQTAEPYVTGQVVFLGINNYLKGSGYGEIVTTKMLQRMGIRI